MRDANLLQPAKYLPLRQLVTTRKIFTFVCLWSFFPPQFLLNLAGSVMLYISVLPVRMTLYTSLAKAKTVMLDGEFVNFKIRLQHVVWNKATDWLIGVKFTRGFKATIKCGLPRLYRVQENHLIYLGEVLRSFANTNRAIVRPWMNLSNF